MGYGGFYNMKPKSEEPEDAKYEEPFTGYVEWQLPFEDLESERLIGNRIMIIVWLSVALALGLPGNILVIASISLIKALRQTPHLLLVNLAVADLGGMVRGCFMLLGSLYGDSPYRENPLLCEINGMICTLACCGSLWTMMFIAINRYTYVCRNSLYTRIFTLKGTLASICLIWTFTLCVDLPRLLGFGGHAYSGLYLFCSGYVQEGSWWFNVGFYTIMALVVPMIVITICYAKIWRLASRSSAALDNVSKRRQREQRQLLVSLVAIYLTFLVTWMPYAFLVLVLGLKVEVYARMPMEFFLLLDLWAHSNAAINFFIYGATHSGFRKAYKHLLAKVIPCYNPKNRNPTLHSKSAPGRKSGTVYDETRET